MFWHNQNKKKLTQFVIDICPTLLCQQLIGNNTNTTLLAGFLHPCAISTKHSKNIDITKYFAPNKVRYDVNESCDVWSKPKWKQLYFEWRFVLY